MSTKEAHEKLKGTFSKDKNEMLFTQFGINYNNIEEVYKRGSILIRMIDPKKLAKDLKKQKQKDSKEQY